MSYTKIHNAEQLAFCGQLLFVFEYGDHGGISACATYQSRGEVLATVQARLDRWANPSPPPPVLHDPAVHGWMPGPAELEVWYAWLKQATEPKKLGFALFVGRGPVTQYIASADREGMAGALKEYVDGARKEMA